MRNFIPYLSTLRVRVTPSKREFGIHPSCARFHPARRLFTRNNSRTHTFADDVCYSQSCSTLFVCYGSSIKSNRDNSFTSPFHFDSYPMQAFRVTLVQRSISSRSSLLNISALDTLRFLLHTPQTGINFSHLKSSPLYVARVDHSILSCVRHSLFSSADIHSPLHNFTFTTPQKEMSPA